MNILILEDDENQSSGLSQYLKEYEKDFHIYMEKDYDSAKKRAFHVPIDLFFLDIELEKEKNGLDFGMILRQDSRYKNTPVIYLSVRTDYVFSALNDLHCYAFLPKPYKKEDVFRLLNEILKSSMQEPQKDSLLIKDKNGVSFRLQPSDIIYVTPMSRRIHIFTTLTEYTTQYMSLSDFHFLFPNLIQIHRKYLVNPAFIKNYDRTNQLIHIGEAVLPVGRNYKITLP